MTPAGDVPLQRCPFAETLGFLKPQGLAHTPAGLRAQGQARPAGDIQDPLGTEPGSGTSRRNHGSAVGVRLTRVTPTPAGGSGRPRVLPRRSQPRENGSGRRLSRRPPQGDRSSHHCGRGGDRLLREGWVQGDLATNREPVTTTDNRTIGKCKKKSLSPWFVKNKKKTKKTREKKELHGCSCGGRHAPSS